MKYKIIKSVSLGLIYRWKLTLATFLLTGIIGYFVWLQFEAWIVLAIWGVAAVMLVIGVICLYFRFFRKRKGQESKKTK